RVLFIGPILAILIFILIWFTSPSALQTAATFLTLWFVSPLIGFILSGPIRDSVRELDDSQKDFLRLLSRRTWRYFEVFVGPGDNWLPPDNYQEFPLETIAHRTSPTNIGMSLLANLAAFDLGYISASMLAKRTNLTFNTLEKIEKFRGHFFNWYDTQTLKPLMPQYVSTVDSGNFAGLVLTLGSGLNALADRRIIELSALIGLRDTAKCLRDLPTLSAEYKSKLSHLLTDLELPIATLKDANDLFQKVKSTLTDLHPGEDEEVQWWLEALRKQSKDVIEDALVDFAPWCLLPREPDAPFMSQLFKSQIFNLDEILTFQQTADLADSELPKIAELLQSNQKDHGWLLQLQAAVNDASTKAASRLRMFSELASRCSALADCEYDFLYDKSRHLLAIGYNVSDHRRDESYYDLLASEARLGSFVAIAQGHLPQDHWFAMGRILTAHKGEPTLLSWSGSMFEYLMPLLVMPNFSNTLLDQSYRAAVRRQIEYGAQRNVPWGISESGYMATDIHLNYQYRAFGVPGLGFKRGLSEDLVVAPYASVMALMVAPYEACNNLLLMAEQGFMGRYGFYEAVDYTKRRLEAGNDKAIVKSFMAHHEGMSLLAIVYHLLNKKMQQRFLSLPLFKSTELLLHERVPKASVIYPHAPEVSEASEIIGDPESFMRVIHTPDTPRPEVHLLSNGRYTVMVTNAGGGYSTWQGIAITRWREDPTCDDWGTFCYLKDLDSGDVWSASFQPTRKRASQYEAIFTPSKAEFRRRDRNFELHTEIAVSPEDDIELRRFTITNLSDETRTIELTSYAEVVLAPQASDAAHPAFSNLFIQTRIVKERNAIICTRRPRSKAEKTPTMMHLMTIHGSPDIQASCDTDRASFLGRGRSTSDPKALDGEGNLAGHEGSVLDPIVAVRCRITLKPEQTIKAHLVTGVGETEAAALDLIERYHDAHIADRVFDLAWTHQNVAMRQFNITASDAQIFGRLASSVIYSNSFRRANTQILAKNRRGQDGLWGHGISGDLPIVLLKVSSEASMRLVRELVQAHGYWRRLGLNVELLIWNEDESGYRQQLQDQIMAAISLGDATQFVDRPGGIFIRRSEHMAEEDRILMQTVARVVITDRDRSLADLLKGRGPIQVMMPPLKGKRPSRSAREQASDVMRLPKGLIFANKYGGFSADGREYYIKISKDNMTPMPWVNVIANPSFGTVVSESGSSYSWCENAHDFRLSPWHNDAVTDRCGEVVYLRDEESGMVWSTTLLPSPSESSYLTCHGFGYSRFSHVRNGISSELTMFVAIDAPVKILKLKLRNLSDRSRRISVTCYCEWVLGELRTNTMPHIVSEFDLTSGSISARNPYHSEFGGRIGFLNVSEKQRTFTGDRTEFIGRNGSLASPLSLMREHLSGRTGAALDPCAAMQSAVELDVGEDREIVFILGVGRDLSDVHTLLSRFGTPSSAQRAFDDVQNFWRNQLSILQIRTADPSVDLLANGWLIYQMMSSRIWARSGYY
ncbi:MAG: cyclic beta 1-2 glucan synthetase, partial [Pseudomonadota bacterium]